MKLYIITLISPMKAL